MNKSLYGLCPSRKQASRLQSKTDIYTLTVDGELAHVKSTAFNFLNKTLFTKRRARGVNEKI
ncbi:hypothetical protein CXF89_18030 [Pseudoalteromonas sp. MelDa3]|nr:hypothetical protein CXF89_18030 [Pseudoalteromonas sp. MelDa3]